MKKLTAFLLTLTLLLGMVGTVSLAADDVKGTTFPTESVIIDKAGNVAITFAGVDAFDTGSAVVTVKTKDGKEKDVNVVLAYDSVKKVFTGQNADAASGIIKSFSLEKYEAKTATDGSTSEIMNYAGFTYFTSTALKGKLKEAYIDKETKATGKTGLTTKTTQDYQTVSYDDVNGRIIKDEAFVTETTFNDKGQKNVVNTTSTQKSFFEGTGVYSGKTVVVTKDTFNFDVDAKDPVAQTVSTKDYNLDNKLVGTTEATTTIALNAAKDIKTKKYDGVSKSFSTKNVIKQTTKDSQTTAWTKVDGTFVPASVSGETKITDGDGKLKFQELTGKNYYNGELLVDSTTTKNYNTYTGKLTHELVSTTKIDEDKTTKAKKELKTSTETFNNDDGSLRRKIVKGQADGEDFETEIHYNKDNKIAATKDKDGTWKDGLGNVIGTNTEKEDSWTKTDVKFRKRTGEISEYRLVTNTVNKDNISVYTDVVYKNGQKTTDYKSVYNLNDGSYATYQNGVMREYFSEKDGVSETKKYDIKGTLKETVKDDANKGIETTYDYRGKVKKIIEEKDGTTTIAKYDPDTEKMTEMSISKDDVTGYYDANGTLIYTKEYDEKTETYIYRDPSFGEFARTYEKGNAYAKQEKQYFTANGKPTGKSADVTLEKEVINRDYQVKETTTTKDYTKWSVTGGIKGPDVTRKEVIKQTYSDDVDKTTVTKDGILTKDTTKNKNAYDDVNKTTVTYYDWYSGAMSGKVKTLTSGNEYDPMSYGKVYDKHNNLQTYSETDNTDEWNWTHTYFANGVLKNEYWADSDVNDDNEDNASQQQYSQYSVSYYLDGTPARKITSNLSNGNDVVYNRNGSWSSWSDTVNGVTNTWEYDVNGNLTGYDWNHKNSGNVESYDYYDAAGNLIYSYLREDGLADGNHVTRYDPAGNRWTKVGNTVTLTLANGGSGWQSAVGKWFYIENGKPIQSKWKKIDGDWYYFNADRFMVTGIATEAKKDLDADDLTVDRAYALDGKTGALVIGGWVNVGDERGSAWAFTDANGEVLTGWQQIGGKWYYFTDGWDDGHSEEYKDEAEWSQSGPRGIMIAGGAASIWNEDWDGKHTYFFNADGTWDNSPGWKVAEKVEVGSLGTDGNEMSDSERETLRGVEYHYYDKNGNEVTGWNLIDGEWYYFNEDGVMRNGWVKSGDKWYFMDPTDGALATNGWVEDVYEGWYYMDKNGQYQTGWLKDGNQWYYLKSDGAMAENEWAKSGNNWYYMDKNGQIATGWIQDKGSWYYLNKDGAMKTGWEGSGNTWYYLGEDGAMVTNTDKTIDGKVYHFDENGLCTNPY